jgi:MFS family permease
LLQLNGLFFYGWVILLVSSFGIIMSIPGQTMGVSAFTEHLIKALKISRTDLTMAYMIGTASSSLILPLAGKAFDRWGARIIACSAAVGLGLTLLALSGIGKISVWLYSAGFKMVSVIAMMSLGFFFLRFFGQGVLTMSSRNMLMKWFDRKRGLLTGISGPIVSFGFAIAPLTLNWLIIRSGWQGAWQLLGLSSLIILTIAILIFFRDNPEDCDLLPDGDKEVHLNNSGKKAVEVKDFTLKEARRTFPFWIICFTLALASFLMTAIPFHIASIFKLAGMTEKQAFSIFPYSSIISVIMTLAGGYASDRIKIKYLLMIMLCGLAVTGLAIAFLAPGAMVIVLICGYAFGGGLFSIMTNVPIARFYGRKHLGENMGFIMSSMVFASATAPWFFSKSLDWTGSYKAAAIGCSVIALLLFIGAFKTNNPQENKQ